MRRDHAEPRRSDHPSVRKNDAPADPHTDAAEFYNSTSVVAISRMLTYDCDV